MIATKAKRRWLQKATQLVSRFFSGLWQALDAPGPSQYDLENNPIYTQQKKPNRSSDFTLLRDKQRAQRMEDYRSEYNATSRNLARRLANGSLELDDWYRRMKTEIYTLHVNSTVIGVGGWGKLSGEQMAITQEMIARQMLYLENWYRQLQAMDIKDLNENQIAARAKLYGGASSETFEKAMTISYGLPILPFYPADRTICRTNCGCRWEIRKLSGDGNYDVYWRRAKDDSCDTCLTREAKVGGSTPLRIRNGEIQPFDSEGTTHD